MRVLPLLPAALLVLQSVVPASASPSSADPGPPIVPAVGSATGLDGWFADWLLGGADADAGPGEAPERERHAALEAARVLLEDILSEEAGISARMSETRAAAATAAEDAARTAARAAELSDELDRMALALASARAESLPSDMRAVTLLEPALVALAARYEPAQAAADRAAARAAATSLALVRAEEAYAAHVSARSAAADEYAELVFGTAAELSGRSWGYDDGLPCPLYAPSATMRHLTGPSSEEGAGTPAPDGVGEAGLMGTSDGGEAPVSASDPAAAPADGSWAPVFDLCVRSAAAAPSREASAAVRYAFHVLGAPYACDGVGRTEVFRFDCSSFVSRAFAEGAGMPVATGSWAPSTRDMVPWDGHALAGWVRPVASEETLPGDMWLFDTGLATSRHVVMLLADGLMVHTNRCGDVLHVARSWSQDLPEGVLDLGPRRAVFKGWEGVEGDLEDLSDASTPPTLRGEGAQAPASR